MHLPDEFLSSGTAASLAGAAATVVALALQKVRKGFLEKVPLLKARLATFPDFGGASVSVRHQLSKMGREKIWRMAAVGSLIFSVQMVNFLISGGTSGHLMGGVLAALILGPFEALLSLTVVLVTQAFLFGDGGVLALGANIFNMGVIGALGGFALFRLLVPGEIKGTSFLKGAFMAAWLSVMAAATVASLELAISGAKSLSTVLPAMVLTHTAIGFGEGMITVVVLSLLLKKGYKLAVFEKQVSYEEK